MSVLAVNVYSDLERPGWAAPLRCEGGEGGPSSLQLTGVVAAPGPGGFTSHNLASLQCCQQPQSTAQYTYTLPSTS